MSEILKKYLKKSDYEILIKSKEKKKKEINWTSKQTEVLNCSSSNIILSGGYGSGKTLVGFYKFIHWLTEAPNDSICIGFSSKTLRDRLNQAFTELGLNIHINENTNKFKYNGATVFIYGSDNISQASRIRSLNLSYMYVDEPTVIGFLEETYNKALSRLRVGAPKIIITTNPSSPNHWVKKNIVDNPNFTSFTFTTFDNPNIKPSVEEYIKTMGLQEGTPKYNQYILGNWIEDGYEL